jgi:hypothetical protein
MKNKLLKILYITIMVIGGFELLYTFGYQGEPMTQFGFLFRALGSLGFISFGGVMFSKVNKIGN